LELSPSLSFSYSSGQYPIFLPISKFLVKRGLIRAIYRVIELAGGWDGRVIETEVYFSTFFPLLSIYSGAHLFIHLRSDVLDGAMITLAMFTLNFFHPGCLLAEAWEDTSNQPSMEQLEKPAVVAV
jgi:hypothetical protein